MSKILIVDDQEQSLYLLKSFLIAKGHVVVEATNGSEALERARANPPDAIISDILMPVMDGFSLCHEWTRDESLKNIPFVFYTATYTDPKDEELALRLGATRFIVKPVEMEEFASILNRVLAEVQSEITTTPQEPVHEETTYYRMYNERLIRKLEDKMLELEKINQILGEEISERKRADLEITRLLEESQQRLKQMESLHAIDLIIGASMDLHITLNILLKHVESLLGVDAADILLLIPNSRQFRFSAERGFRTNSIERSSVPLSTSFAEQATLERRTIIISGDLGTQADQEFSKMYKAEGFLAYTGVPLIAKGQIKGVLEVYHRSVYQVKREWLNLLETLAGQAALAIDNAQLFEGLQQSNTELALAYDATIAGWSHAMDLRDKETEGHTQRVSEMTIQLARKMSIAPQELIHIRRGALLHDIGKLGVPDHILLKPGELTDEEWEIMRQHPVYAYNMLTSITYLRHALDIPYCHHEKWDGSGYPRQLKGEQIPLSARLFAVVDVWDALGSDRPYRKAWPKEKILKYIQEESGKHFDPQVVDTFMEVIL